VELSIFVIKFNSLGGYGFTPLRYVFESAEKDFGSAIHEIVLNLHFPSALPFEKQRCSSTLKSSFEEFHQTKLPKLPTSRFLRKKNRLVFDAVADFANAEGNDGGKIHLDWQRRGLDVLIDRMKASRRKFKATDDFHLDEFLNWLSTLHDSLPTTQKEAEELDQRWQDFQERHLASLSDWEKLGVDFEDYHPDARRVVDDPSLWSMSHDFSPNGNDSGADLLDIFRRQKSRIKKAGGRAFLKTMERDWEFDLDQEPDDSIEYETKREVVIALAFAYLKFFACCPNWLVEKTVDTIKAHQRYLKSNHLDWPHRDGCIDYQNRMLKVLSSCPRE